MYRLPYYLRALQKLLPRPAAIAPIAKRALQALHDAGIERGRRLVLMIVLCRWRR